MSENGKEKLFIDKAALRAAIIYSFLQEKKNNERFALPYPPSLNSYYRYNLRTNKMYTSKEGKAYRKSVYECLLNYTQKNDTINQEIVLNIILYPPDKRKRDVDNVLKVLLDALQDAKLIKDDSLIQQLSIKKEYDILKPGLVLIEIIKI